MENVLGEDLPVGVYRTNDKIKNMKIRVKLRKIPNACFIEKDSLTFGDTSEFELMNLMKTSAVSDERIFTWQEKVEKIRRDDDDKLTDGSVKKSSLSIYLFSYTDSEIHSSERKGVMSCTYPSSHLSHLEKQMSKLKPRTRLNFSDSETWQKPFFSNMKNIVKERSNLKNLPLSVGQSMILMAALFFDDSQNSEEIKLCFLQVDDNGSLTVIPDFNQKKSYIFVNSRSETFEYEIENVSNTLSNSAAQREKHLLKKIALYKEKIKGDTVGTEFNKPLPETAFYTLNCEIVCAEKVSSSDIFIHYLIILPKGMSSENNLEGVTETCRCKTKNMTSVAYFGYLFSLDITAHMKIYNEEPVKIIFDVTSVDYWGNFRNEGYGYSDITLIPGINIFDIYTWKIEPTNLRHKLQNFFIGGMPYLEDLSYVVNTMDIKDSQVSRYGVRTISSGIVTFKSNIIRQNHCQ